MIEGNFWKKDSKDFSKEFFGQIFLETKENSIFLPLKENFSINEKRRPCLVKNCHWPQKSQFFSRLTKALFFF